MDLQSNLEMTGSIEFEEKVDIEDLVLLSEKTSTPNMENNDIKEEPMDFDDPDWTNEEPEKKRGRGRPRIPRPYPEPPK